MWPIQVSMRLRLFELTLATSKFHLACGFDLADRFSR